MAPEVGMHQPYNELCDVYSFGVLVWEMMALTKPYGNIDMASLIRDVWKDGPDAIRPSPSLVEKGDILACSVWKGMRRNRSSSDYASAETVVSPAALQQLLSSCWSYSLNERPKMSTVEMVLREERAAASVCKNKLKSLQ